MSNHATALVDPELDEPLRAIRRRLHACPEIGFEEVETSRLIAEILRELRMEVHEGIATTGVVGVLKGLHPGDRTIALRADMDGLRITEQNDFAHRSTVPGKMHACGHDGHTTMLLGAAMQLARHRDFGGKVIFVFQPAEENLGGARVMLDAGLLDRFPCDAIYGMHVRPGFAAGHFCTRSGPMFAASDRWSARFEGTGGHGGSLVHLSTDATLPLGHFLLGLHSIVARNVPAHDSAVLSVGFVTAGDAGAANVIPSSAVIGGTARTYAESTRATLERRIAELALFTAEAHGCTATSSYERGYPPLLNTAREVDVALAAAEAAVGAHRVTSDMEPRMASDDFAYYLQRRPGAFVMIGNGVSADGSFHGVHTSRFDFNDDIIIPGVRYWVHLVERELRQRA